MDADLGLQLVIILVLIIANGIFSMTEIAIINARKARLESLADEGNEGAALAMKLAENPNQMFSTIQIGITLISIITGLYSGNAFSEPMAIFIHTYIPMLSPYAETISPLIIVALITYLSLVIGELVPKRLAYNSPEQIAILIARPMNMFAKLTAPLVTFLSVSTEALLKLMGIANKEEAPVTENEIKIMLTQGAEMGAFEKEEPELVDNVFRLADLSAGDVMTPRTQLEWLDLNKSMNELEDLISNSHHYILPVAEDSLDELKGLVNISDIFARQLQTKHKVPLEELIISCIKEPLMVPESITLMKLLEQFRTEGVHQAVVLDEYGGFSGLATLHDIMEELVGLMPSGEEEIKEEENRIKQRTENTWLVDGLVSVEELKTYFNISKFMPGEEDDLYKTVGGFVMYLFGRIPKEMDKAIWENYTFEVIDMDNRRVDKILITYVPPINEKVDDEDD